MSKINNLSEKKDLLSVIVPCYNEEEVIQKTIFSLVAVCGCIQQVDYEIIFINDGSIDHTLDILQKNAQNNQKIKVISFSRNFGHQMAVSAGIDAASGDVVVLIDADLQDPPEAIVDMIVKWREGYDVVYGTRTERFGESFFKLKTAKFFYRIINWLSDTPIPLDTGDFRLMNREVVDVLSAMPERDRFIRGMVSWVGFKQISLPYARSARLAGESKYPIFKMIKFAIDGIISFSIKPLQLSVLIGMICAAFSSIGIIYVIYLRVFTSIWVEGWTAIMVTILFIGGIQLISLGILGEYIGRIYNESKRRPLYIVDEVYNLDNKHINPRISKLKGR